MNIETNKQSIRWTNEEIEFLKANWGIMKLPVLAEKLNRTEAALRKKARRLELSEKYINNWSQEDINYLIEHWGGTEFRTLRKRLKRTHYAIKKKAYELNLGPAVSAMGEFLTVYRISQAIGVKRETVLNWGNSYGLPVEVRSLNKKPTYMVQYDELMIWLEENQDKWNASKMESYALGIEPEWLKEKSKRDKVIPHKVDKRFWTPEEDAQIRCLYLSGLTTREIAFKLKNRTPKAVEKRLTRINLWDTNIKKSPTKAIANW